MFYVRSPCAGSQEAIAGALALVWQVSHFRDKHIIMYMYVQEDRNMYTMVLLIVMGINFQRFTQFKGYVKWWPMLLTTLCF